MSRRRGCGARALAALLSLCCSCAAAAAPPIQRLALGANASSERQQHVAAHAFDASSATYWQSRTPASGSWLLYTFPEPQTVLQYALTVPDDPRWAASDGLAAWELQGSADGGASWRAVDRRFDQPLWRPRDTRVFTVRPPGGAELMAPYDSYRLLVVKVPGRRADESYASVSDLRFLTAEAMPPFCDSVTSGTAPGGVTVNLTLVGAPPPAGDGSGAAVDAAAPHAQLQLFLNVTNGAVNPVSLRGTHLPVRFSRAVQGWDGAWATAQPASFTVACWGAYVTGDPGAKPNSKMVDLCQDAKALKASVTDFGVDIFFDKNTLLCPGCTLSGPPGGTLPMFVVQHGSYGRMDLETAAVAAPVCSVTVALQPTRQPGAERHPACAPWADGLTPTCASGNLSALRVSLAYAYADGPADPTTGRPQPARELRLRPSVRNDGATSVPLFGASFTVAFPMSLKSANEGSPFAPAMPDDYSADCFWAQVVTPGGLPIYGQRNSCEYLSARVSESGVTFTFVGGSLCAGCTLAGAAGAADAMVNVKGVNYGQMATQPKPLIAGNGKLGCAEVPAPPARCTSPV